MTNTSSFALLISQNPQWATLSWETKGMALQLMAMGDENHLNTLSPEDDFWRNCLNIPSKMAMERALKQSVSTRGAKHIGEIDIAWNEVWKPELLRWFVLIDDVFLQKHPEFSSAKGRYWHPLLQNEAPQVAQPRGAAKKSTKTTAKKKPKVEIKISDFAQEWDYAPIRYSSGVLKKCWSVPITQQERLTIWSDAVHLLSDGIPSQEATARQFLGKLIKEFGESQVAQAVGHLIVRTPKPADCKSFLRKQLKNATEGSEAMQRARRQRVKIPL